MAPKEFLSVLKEVETEVGRTRTYRNGPRVVDLDIVFFDDLVLDESGPEELDSKQRTDLTIPHLSMLEREFVLRPLAE